MKPELEALKKQYQERSEKNQCVMCGEALNPDYEVQTLTGWARCYSCAQYYDLDGHRTFLNLELSKKAKEIGVSSKNLPEDVEQEVYWQCEGW